MIMISSLRLGLNVKIPNLPFVNTLKYLSLFFLHHLKIHILTKFQRISDNESIYLLLKQLRLMGVLASVKRNLASVLFPTGAFGLIYADWSYTRRWKARKLEEKNQQKAA